ncbi:tetratricopeptide repeat protein [Spirillospora sp. NPDC047279]|uniref:SEL1-like repeat protein n=1 Tax=Spirillospora sp. NPDC047279 TaxID=3155478 RepID=UPI0033D716EA
MRRDRLRRWVWLLDAVSAGLVVAIGVATNQILNDGRWAWWWLAGDLALAGLAVVVTHKVASVRAGEDERDVEPVAWPALTRPDGTPKTFTEVTPRALGVHPNRFGAEGEALYIPRDVDETLGAALAGDDRQVVIVQGPRLAGTTSTLAQAAQSHLPRHRVIGFVDDPRVPLTDMIDHARRWTGPSQGAVLWLDGLDPGRYVELATLPGGETGRIHPGLKVLATFDDDALKGLRIHEHLVEALRERAVRIDLGALSADERADVADQEVYADLRPILAEGTGVLMGRLMTTWEQIRAALTETGEDATERLALVRAVTDWYRVAVPRLLNRDVLDYLYRIHHAELTGRPAGAPSDIDAYGSALTWATTRTPDRPQLISRQKLADGHRHAPHPLLSVLADDPEDQAAWPVGDALWRYANTFLSGDARRDLGYTALQRGAHSAARRLLDHADTTVDPAALRQIAERLQSTGDTSGARHWYQRIIATGDPEHAPRAMCDLGILEKRQDDLEQGRHWYGRAIATGHADERPRALFCLGILEEEKQGDLTRARHWYEQAVATEHPDHASFAMSRLGHLEHVHGDADQARYWYHRAIAAGHADEKPRALFNLGFLEARQGDPGESRRYYWRTIATGHPEHAPFAMRNLAVLEERQGDAEQARRWYRRAATTRQPECRANAMYDMGRLEDLQGDVEQARYWYRQAAATGHPEYGAQAMCALGILEKGQDDLEQGRHWYGRAIATGHAEQRPRAMYCLGILEEEKQGDLGQARHWYRQAVATEHPEHASFAMSRLGYLEHVHGDAEQARYWYRRVIASGHPDEKPRGMVNRGILESREGDVEQARHWYRQAIATGHPEEAPFAMYNLAGLEEWEGDIEQARHWYREAITTGHPEMAAKAASSLSGLERRQRDDQRAEHFRRFGWQTFADPALMRRPGEPANEESAQRPPQ